jgi:putative transposase
MVSHLRECLFGEVENHRVVLNAFGEIVTNEWQKSSDIRKTMEFDVFVIMPNHIHGIVHIVNCRGDQPVAPTTEHPLANGMGEKPDFPARLTKQPVRKW